MTPAVPLRGGSILEIRLLYIASNEKAKFIFSDLTISAPKEKLSAAGYVYGFVERLEHSSYLEEIL
jgi:pyruvoyl-dependent arginine decarboxylase (PvlArgDC)